MGDPESTKNARIYIESLCFTTLRGRVHAGRCHIQGTLTGIHIWKQLESIITILKIIIGGPEEKPLETILTIFSDLVIFNHFKMVIAYTILKWVTGWEPF